MLFFPLLVCFARARSALSLQVVLRPPAHIHATMASVRIAVKLLPAANGEEAPLASAHAAIVDEQTLRDLFGLPAPVDCAFPSCQNHRRVTFFAGHAVFA